MVIKKKQSIYLVILIMIVFFFQSCMTIARGGSQKIPVTSDPIGAKIIVNGEEMGFTPIYLKLRRRKNHVIQIEKQSYIPLEIRTTPKFSIGTLGGSILLNSLTYYGVLFGIWIAALINNDNESVKLIKPWYYGGWIGMMLVDLFSGSYFSMSPDTLRVTLEKSERKTHVQIMLLDSEILQNIKWIRIKCDDSDEEVEFLNLN